MDIGTFNQYIQRPPAGPAIVTANLEGQYAFESLNDLSGNSRHLTTAGTPTTTADGIRVQAADVLEHVSNINLPNLSALTLQMVIIFHTFDTYNHVLDVRSDTTTALANVGTRGTATNYGIGFRNDAGTNVHNDTIEVLTAGTAYMLTMRWDGSNWYARRNKVAVAGPTAATGTVSVEYVRVRPFNTGDFTCVYGVWYSSFLSVIECDANYDAIAAEVNSRPGVALP